MPKSVENNISYKADQIPEKDKQPIFTRVTHYGIYTVLGVENMFQFCKRCHSLKSEKEFNVQFNTDTYGRKKLENSCRTCLSKKNLDIYYLKKENGPPPSHCQLCGEESNKLQLDHCHITGKFRGWLCYSCNLGLGKLRDSVELLQRGIKYLKGEIENEEDKQED